MEHLSMANNNLNQILNMEKSQNGVLQNTVGQQMIQLEKINLLSKATTQGFKQ